MGEHATTPLKVEKEAPQAWVELLVEGVCVVWRFGVNDTSVLDVCDTTRKRGAPSERLKEERATVLDGD